MRPDNLNIFDLDGTLIKVNSFKEINKQLIFILLRKFQFYPIIKLLVWYFIRKLRIVSHLEFKQYAVNIFEKTLAEKEKRNIVKHVLDENINQPVYDLMLKADNCLISTAAPFAYVSRMCFRKDVIIISSLDPQNSFPDPSNFGAGKVTNIKNYFKGDDIRIVNFYTDSMDDQALIELSVNAFILVNDCLVRVN